MADVKLIGLPIAVRQESIASSVEEKREIEEKFSAFFEPWSDLKGQDHERRVEQIYSTKALYFNDMLKTFSKHDNLTSHLPATARKVAV